MIFQNGFGSSKEVTSPREPEPKPFLEKPEPCQRCPQCLPIPSHERLGSILPPMQMMPQSAPLSKKKKKKETRERQDCQCAGWVHSPPIDPETKRCGWHPPTAERPSPEIEGAWRLEKATAVMDKLLRQIRCS